MSKPNDIVSIILQERDGIAGKSTSSSSSSTGGGFSLGSFLINIVWVLLLVFVIVALSAYFSPSCNEESSWLTYTLCLYRNFTTKIFEVTNAFVKKDVEATATENPEKEKEKEQEKEEVTNDDETAKKYEEDSSSSNIQEGSGKKGWCFIGKDRGVRSCAKVGLNDTCMSGDIFPTSDICVNPRLRV